MSRREVVARVVDWYIVLPAIFLVVIGLTIQSSIANKTTGVPLELNVGTQVAALILGLLTVVIFYQFKLLNKHYLVSLTYLLGVLLLVAVLGFGVSSNGSQRWLSLGSLQLQPTEIAKIGLVLALAKLFDNRDRNVNRLGTIVKSLALTAIPGGLIILQPDLGSAVVLFVVWITILFASRLKLSNFAFILFALAATVVILIPFMAEYQQERLVSYFNPSHDVGGSSYNVLQADIAIGSGGLLGTGIEAGTQSQLNFLPSQHTDFVFSVTAEKLGLLGAISVILAFIMIIVRISYLSWLSTNQYYRGILVGIVAILFFHSFVNIGMNLGLVPVTGLPLPLLSYGGTFTFVTVIILGLANNISTMGKS